ncbi:hypothetical protein [Chromobacterium sp. IIBBL 290-4]|uniref:hypothetical protein n=1 Tax=Chromobacterium sp. IIBBL 290-4 TaxID=2953890 RepID=UPI0020B81EF8|nr:hypothetical protein [Chromobacterium sp. IIBBL 290-4]UTH75515.1 hypothetical protein NKT35_05315 [Chromobacterium sp. IIBBL 290-4]
MPPPRLSALLIALLPFAAVSAETANPPPALSSAHPPEKVAECIQQGLQKLHIPPDFIERRDASAGSSLTLRNPVNDASGTSVDILRQADGSQLQVQLNGLPLSPAWKKLIQRCAGKPL